ncbi:hypothetical protein ACSBR1_033829 [Camellia fascicularis]
MGGQGKGQGRGMIEGRTSFFTIFVDNIPKSVNPKGLYNLFSKFGVVKDVFIPQKKRKLTNTRSGFVRFNCSVAAKVAVQKENGLWVDDTAIKAEEIGNGWMYESVVVHLKDKYANVNLKKELEGIGMEDVLIRENEGRDVVLTFKTKEEIVLKIQPIKELIFDWCKAIFEGKDGLVLEQERCVWISYYGVPLNLWNSTNLRRIGGLWGNFLCFDGDSDHPKSFACAKLKISTKCMEPINKVIKLDCKRLLSIIAEVNVAALRLAKAPVTKWKGKRPGSNFKKSRNNFNTPPNKRQNTGSFTSSS